MYLNRAIIVGNLTRDPELKALPSGTSVTSFGIATNHTYKDKDGQKQESAEFHNIIVFGKQAEHCYNFLKKGDQALVEGRIQTRSWEEGDVKKYRTEIIADRVMFGGKRPEKKEEAPEPTEPKVEREPDYEYPTEEAHPTGF